MIIRPLGKILDPPPRFFSITDRYTNRKSLNIAADQIRSFSRRWTQTAQTDFCFQPASLPKLNCFFTTAFVDQEYLSDSNQHWSLNERTSSEMQHLKSAVGAAIRAGTKQDSRRIMRNSTPSFTQDTNRAGTSTDPRIQQHTSGTITATYKLNNNLCHTGWYRNLNLKFCFKFCNKNRVFTFCAT